MTDNTYAPPLSRPEQTPQAIAKTYLFGPVVDFLCLGGGSLLIMFPLFVIAPDNARPSLIIATFFASHLINQPHFAHSYQIFYSKFREKLMSDAYPGFLRLRYAFSGIFVPGSMIIFFVTCYFLEDVKLFSLALNLMALTVGWHYVKQGYGILMVECVLKRCFFNDREKSRLKLNAYLIWFFSWAFLNHAVAESEYQGLVAYSFDLPEWLLTLTAVLAICSTVMTLVTVAAKGVGNRWRLPYNGLLAYVASVYVWVYAIHTDPLLFLFAPVFHSIQYLTVVWRYQLNKNRAEIGNQINTYNILGTSFSLPRHVARLFRFIIIGATMGVVGFHAAPYILTAGSPSWLVFGPTTFLAMFWVFFNVHHYFLDNVMWRKENPEIKKHLFTPA